MIMSERDARGPEENQESKFHLTFVEVLLNFRRSCLFRLPPRQGQCSRQAACRHALARPRASGATTPRRGTAAKAPAERAQRAETHATIRARRIPSRKSSASPPAAVGRFLPLRWGGNRRKLAETRRGRLAQGRDAYPPSACFTAAQALAKSLSPPYLAFQAAVTPPMSLMVLAPQEATASATAASIAASSICLGKKRSITAISAFSLPARSGRLPFS